MSLNLRTVVDNNQLLINDTRDIFESAEVEYGNALYLAESLSRHSIATALNVLAMVAIEQHEQYE